MDDNFKLEEKIKEKFKLFQGFRSQEEDQKMYDKLAELCFDELIVYLSEKLKLEDQESLISKMESVQSDDEKRDLLNEYLRKIEGNEEELPQRMNDFLDDMVYNSQKLQD